MRDELDTDEQLEETGVDQDAGELGSLMQEGAESGVQERLDNEAIAAAEAVLATATSVLRDVDDATAEPVQAVRDQQVDKRKLWMLRAILLLNFALMGVMIALPDGAVSHPATDGEHGTEMESAESGTSPFVGDRRQQAFLTPNDNLYDEAVLAARDGNWDQAAAMMQQHIVKNKATTHESMMQGAYILLASYLRRAGRSDEALEVDAMWLRLVGTTTLPEDLWHMAQSAEKRGDGPAMRQAYARLLLQQNMLTYNQLAVITEAYLKFGDSYRIEAQAGDERAQKEEREREQKLRESGGKR